MRYNSNAGLFALCPENPLSVGTQFQSNVGMVDSATNNENFYIERSFFNINILNGY